MKSEFSRNSLRLSHANGGHAYPPQLSRASSSTWPMTSSSSDCPCFPADCPLYPNSVLLSSLIPACSFSVRVQSFCNNYDLLSDRNYHMHVLMILPTSSSQFPGEAGQLHGRIFFLFSSSVIFISNYFSFCLRKHPV